MYAPSLLTIAACASVGLAIVPFPPRAPSIPSNAAHIAFDRENEVLHAFGKNGESLGSFSTSSIGDLHKRQAGQCGSMAQDEQTNMPGWQSMVDYATSNWGGEYDEVHVNPSEHPDGQALVCANGPVQVSFNPGQPECSTTSQIVNGTFDASSGYLAFAYTEGTTATTTSTVTQTSELGEDITVSFGLSFDDVLDLGGDSTTSVSMTNAATNQTSFQSDTMFSQTINISAEDGETCFLTFSEQTCTAQGTAAVPMTAQGWLWFYYGSRRDGHYEWAVSIENVITDPAQRTSYMQIATSTSGTTISQYNTVCECT